MIRKFLLTAAVILAVSGCSCKDKRRMIEEDLKVAARQLGAFADRFAAAPSTPRSWNQGVYSVTPVSDWTSGFFPGSLWIYYEMTGDKQFEQWALDYTAHLCGQETRTDTHDLGFMIFCSYGHQQKVEKDSLSAATIIRASDALISRFDPKVGLIRSWDFGDWNFPVIIDNMMNLEMLFWASEYTGNPVYSEIAVKHADKTLENHFRDNFSCYHVVSYRNDGSVESKGTYQGFSDTSSWSRGQAWALYGYTVCYRYTRYERYLQQAREVAKLIMTLPDMPEDRIPYWDYDAPDKPNAVRDASAASITASALLELSTMVTDGLSKSYFDYAEKILTSLSSPAYLAAVGENGNFLLKHCTGAASLNSEIDVPLVYGDYYFLEALQRYQSEISNNN